LSSIDEVKLATFLNNSILEFAFVFSFHFKSGEKFVFFCNMIEPERRQFQTLQDNISLCEVFFEPQETHSIAA
jgi:hypothetical protein